MTKIEYFKDGKSLGTYQVCDGSHAEDRDAVAHVNGIEEYDRFVLDDGRVTCAKVLVPVNHYVDSVGNLWLSWEGKAKIVQLIDLSDEKGKKAKASG